MTFPVVEETRVLVATTAYLVGRGVTPLRFSVPHGKGINRSRVRAALSETFKDFGISPQFLSEGADIEGVSEREWWRIECKGSGRGKSPTQRNNFDRALASVVTYYEEPPYSLGPNYSEAKLFLGLALPASPDYLHQLKRRVRSPLRKRLNLWVLLYEPTGRTVKEVSPEQEF